MVENTPDEKEWQANAIEEFRRQIEEMEDILNRVKAAFNMICNPATNPELALALLESIQEQARGHRS